MEEQIAMPTFNQGQNQMIEVNPKSLFRLLGIGIILLFAVILIFSSITRVESGHVGVLTLFGRVTGEVLQEGIHMVNPFKTNHQISIRIQEVKESASVPSSEGLVISLDTSLIYRVNPLKAAEVYQKIGPNYLEVFIEPNLRAAIREATAAHTANALYTGEREMVAKQISTELSSLLEKRGFIVE